MDCIFCKIAKREIPAKIIYQDKEIIVIKNIKPEAPIHLLFILKKHLEWKDSFQKKDLALLQKLISTAKRIAIDQKINKACKLIFNMGETAHISHIHLHLLGGWKKKIPKRNL